ncbi:hypothetical protein P0D62_09630 [Tessaracoccus sp. HF-7]|nr:hypothetical protein [Tessaracoccus caeni]
MSQTMTRPAPARVTGLGGLTLTLTKARFAARQGDSTLYLSATVAYLVTSALALTVAGGTWMFYNRYQDPALNPLLESIGPDGVMLSLSYLILALLACALVVPSMISLAAAAAVLGARGRERRLAALRLLGLSSGDVTRMSLVDTVLQAVIGSLGGLVIYLVSLPAWRALVMQGKAIDASEMMLPWWMILAVLAGTILIGLASTAWGLQQVRISPLGVSRRSVPPALRIWRLWVFLGLVALFFVINTLVPLNSGMIAWLVMIGVIVVVVQGLNLVAPWLLQQVAKLFAHSSNPSIMWAARRIQANAKTTWKRAGGISLLCFIGGFVALTPMSLGTGASQDVFDALTWDFTKGVIITLAVGFVLTSISIFITQASAVFERAEQTVAMDKMGAPATYTTQVMWLETLGPVIIAVVIGAGLGALLAIPMYNMATSMGRQSSDGILAMGVVMAIGILLAMLALAACSPLQRRVLSEHRRAND